MVRVIGYTLLGAGFLWYLVSLGTIATFTYWAMDYHHSPFDSDLLNILVALVMGSWISAPYSLPGLLAAIVGWILVRRTSTER